MLKNLIKPLVIPIFDINYKIRKKLYFKTKMKSIEKTLIELNIQDRNKFNENNWHHGYCYFTGIYNNKKVFIKIDTKLNMLKNEKIFYDIMSENISKYLIPMELFYENENLQLIVYEFMSDYCELNEEKLIKNLNYIDDIYLILKQMKDKKVIHRDINLNNFLVNRNSLKIIDFTFSYSINENSKFKELDISKKENFLLLKGLGRGLNPKNYQWNDSISIIKILKSYYFDAKRKEIDYYISNFKKLSFNNTYSLKIGEK